MNADLFYTQVYDVFSDTTKATKRFPPDNLTLWIINQSKGFVRKGFEKVNKYVQSLSI